MNVVRRLRAESGLTQSELAERAGTSQPAIASYESGAKAPNLRTLQRLAASVGMDVHISFVPALTREDRRSLLLHEEIGKKLRADPSRAREIALSNLDHMRSLHPWAGELLEKWVDLLNGPLDELTSALIDPSPRFRDLRQVTPFAGVLSAAERAGVYAEFRRLEQRR